jgi:glycosyltransferase involved in cell wall biosynthesis
MNENYIKDLISICCLTYNHENFIRESIESIWGQDYRNIEILVLDDGSSDNGYNELLKLQKESTFPMTVIKQ